MKFMYVQSILPQEDVIALKNKTGKSSIKEAIVTAVHFYPKENPNMRLPIAIYPQKSI
jgi:predicted Na+-dependent transporter